MNIRYYHLDSVTSTNTWAKDHASEFAVDELTVISASVQTAGRGRYARSWQSEPNTNLLVSLAFFLEGKNSDSFTICQLAALTLQDFLAKYKISAQIKWPNDLVVDGKKITGLLTERLEVHGMPFIVLGIGLNVNMNADMASQIPKKATSMLLETGKVYTVEAIKNEFVVLFAKNLKNTTEISSKWLQNVQWMVNQPVHIQTNSHVLQGKVLGFDSKGSLILEATDGTCHIIESADVDLA